MPAYELFFLQYRFHFLRQFDDRKRLVKDKLVKNTYYEKYKTFRAKTFQLLNHVDKHVEEFKTLMGILHLLVYTFLLRGV